jgi:sporulation protein YlmC with PRC-barrel domain
MNRPGHFDLMRDLLDHELIDVDGISCGMVDDIEVEHTQCGIEVVALLAGPGAWIPRLPALLRLPLRAIAGTRRTRIPFEAVEKISEAIRLKLRAPQLGLGTADRRAARWLRWVGGA